MRIPKPIKAFGAFLFLVLAISAALALIKFAERTDYVNDASEYDALLQYEWPQLQGDSSFTRFSAGPAPEAPDFLWKTNITGIQSYVSAFNGKVFVTTKTTVFALDRKTGSIVWNATVPDPGPWPAVYKIDNTHMVVGNSCLASETGRILWTSVDFSANPNRLFSANVYSPEEKMFFTKVNSYVQAWNFSDPSIPPTLAWETYVSGSGLSGSGVQYGDGKVFPGSNEPHQMALDAKTGEVLWDTETKCSMVFTGSYYQGRFFRGGSHDNTMYCFNATTGETLWTFNPHTENGYFCAGSAVAYGMVYELNMDGHLYALDVNTGNVVWKYKGPGPLMFPGNPTVADGKIYATTGQTASYANYTSESEFACLDAYTGQPLWKLPIEAFAPRESVAVAYGNLYLIPGYVTTMVDSESGEEYSTDNQVWAIGTTSWPMWRHDPAHSAIGQSGPENLTLRWNFTTNGAVTSSPSIVEGRVYVGSQDKNIYCLDARSGSLIWKFHTNEPNMTTFGSSPAVAGGKVYIGPDDGNFYILDADTGEELKRVPMGTYRSVQISLGQHNIDSSPIIYNNRVYVASIHDSLLHCLDLNGVQQWTVELSGQGSAGSVGIADDHIYILDYSRYLYKINMTGGVVWTSRISSVGMGSTSYTPVVVGDYIYIGVGNRNFMAYNVTDGSQIFSVRQPHVLSESSHGSVT